MSEPDLLESYPRLTVEMVRLAPTYAAAYPLRGRPKASVAQSVIDPGQLAEADDRHGGMRFLIDECLSVDLILIARQAGHEAQHVAHVGMAGWEDWNVLRHAAEAGFVLETNNVIDFRRLYATQTLHAGLVIIVPQRYPAVAAAPAPGGAGRAGNRGRADQPRVGGQH